MKKVIYSFAAILILALPLFAQGGGSIGTSNPISAAMGNTYVSNSTGVYSIHRNPANLALMPDNEFQLATLVPIPTINIFGGTDFISINEYNYFFGGVDQNGSTVGRYLSTEDKDRLRNLFKDGGNFKEDLSVTMIAMAYNLGKDIGTIAFSIDDAQSSQMTIPDALVDLALEGNPIGKAYDFSGLDFRANWIRYYSLSYARDISELFKGTFKSFTVGTSLKMVKGFAHVSTNKVNTKFITLNDQNKIQAVGDVLAYAAFSPDLGVKYDFDSTDTESSMSPFPTPAGSGFGFDIGFNAKLDDIFTFGLSITDIGSITWDVNAAEYSSQAALVIDDVTDQDQLDSLGKTITGDGKYIDSFSSDLPTALRLGASARIDKLVDGFPGTMLAVMDYNQGFNDAPRNSKTPRISIGAEWRPFEIWPIRTGFSFGGLFGFGWSFGTGIDTGLFEFSLATERLTNFLDANNAQKISVSMGTRWRF